MLFSYYIKHVSQSTFFLKKYIEGKTWLNSVNIKIIFDIFNTKFMIYRNFFLN